MANITKREKVAMHLHDYEIGKITMDEFIQEMLELEEREQC